MAGILETQNICVDNPIVRNQILSDTKFGIQSVPCILIVYPEGAAEKYEGDDAFELVNKHRNQFMMLQQQEQMKIQQQVQQQAQQQAQAMFQQAAQAAASREEEERSPSPPASPPMARSSLPVIKQKKDKKKKKKKKGDASSREELSFNGDTSPEEELQVSKKRETASDIAARMRQQRSPVNDGQRMPL